MIPLPFNKLLCQKIRRNSETQSEISSVDSDYSGDIRAIALQLGVANVEDLSNERFKVDRQKLESMIKVASESEGTNGAEDFFNTVSAMTSFDSNRFLTLKFPSVCLPDYDTNIDGYQLALSLENWRQNEERSTCSNCWTTK